MSLFTNLRCQIILAFILVTALWASPKPPDTVWVDIEEDPDRFLVLSWPTVQGATYYKVYRHLLGNAADIQGSRHWVEWLDYIRLGGSTAGGRIIRGRIRLLDDGGTLGDFAVVSVIWDNDGTRISQRRVFTVEVPPPVPLYEPQISLVPANPSGVGGGIELVRGSSILASKDGNYGPLYAYQALLVNNSNAEITDVVIWVHLIDAEGKRVVSGVESPIRRPFSYDPNWYPGQTISFYVEINLENTSSRRLDEIVGYRLEVERKIVEIAEPTAIVKQGWGEVKKPFLPTAETTAP